MRTPPLRWVLPSLFTGVLVIFLVYLCAFKIIDLDVWWDLKAGQIMWQTHRLITVEPFAYTRLGLPYLINHEWLAQIIFYLVHHIGGVTGTILLRTALIVAAFVTAVYCGKKVTYPVVLLAVWMAMVSRPSFLDRPQLFTFALLPLCIFLAFLYLEQSGDTAHARSTRFRILIGMIGAQVLWVNLHGGSSLQELLVFGAIGLQRLFEWLKEKDASIKKGLTREIKILAAAGAGLAVAAFASPNAFNNYYILYDLLSQKPAEFLKEWQPRPFGIYIHDFAIAWIAVGAALAFARRRWLFCSILLVVFGYASLHAYRHGILFGLVCVAIGSFQLADNKKIEKILYNSAIVSLSIAVACAAVFGWEVHILNTQYNPELKRGNLLGYGVIVKAESAYDFVERVGLKGKMFNSYNLGDYLLYRGSTSLTTGGPDRLIFIDGREVNYGYAFVDRALRAGTNWETWKGLDEEYKFDYAIIDYEALPSGQPLQYVANLERDPRWVLVYVDDNVAVYAKDTPANKEIINANRYQLLTPNGIAYGTALDTIKPNQASLLEQELTREVKESANGINGRLLLGHLLLDKKRPDAVVRLMEETAALHPSNSQVFELLGQGYLGTNQLPKAAEAFDRAVQLCDEQHIPQRLNFAALADLFANIGNNQKAAEFTRRAFQNPIRQ